MPPALRWSIAGPTGQTGSCCWSAPWVLGSSHLAAIWAEQAGARSISAHALTAAAVPGALATGALVVEDLKSPDVDERALFHLLNLAREDQAFVLITARAPPSALQIELRDLRSRLRAVPTVLLLPPDDHLFRALIVKFCADRQLAVDEAVVSHPTTRIERSYAAVRHAVELLDSEALRLGRPVTSSRRILLLSTARVLGDIKTPELIIQDGVILEGRCTISHVQIENTPEYIQGLYNRK